METFNIGSLGVGEGNRCLIIAEAGVNHNGDLKNAKKLVDVAKEAGADIVKFQTFRTERLITPSVDMAPYQKKNTKVKQTQYDMLKKLELGEADFRTLFDYCRKKGMPVLSTPFDHESVDMLERLGVPAYKIASGEVTNIPLIEKIAATGKPMILSTGTATYEEISDAVKAARSSGGIALLHCVTDYPARFEDINLRVMSTLENMFSLPVGFSDHTPGIEASVAAVALGAKIIEKHFTLDKNMPGPDHAASLGPEELSALVKSVRNVEKALGDGVKRLNSRESRMKPYMRKSIVAVADIRAGERFTAQNIAIMRPELGIPPKHFRELLGKTAARDIKKFEPLTWADVER